MWRTASAEIQRLLVLYTFLLALCSLYFSLWLLSWPAYWLTVFKSSAVYSVSGSKWPSSILLLLFNQIVALSSCSFNIIWIFFRLIYDNAGNLTILVLFQFLQIL